MSALERYLPRCTRCWRSRCPVLGIVIVLSGIVVGAMAVRISIDGVSQQVASGLVRGAQLYELAGCHPQRLFLSRKDDVDIPVLPNEYLLIRGNERLVLGDSRAEDDPPLRSELKPEFNGAHDLALSRAKMTAKALKAHDPQFPDGRMFVDIPDGVDVELDDDMWLVVQDSDSYFVIPPGDFGGHVDLEECSKHGRRPPSGSTYRYRLDRDTYTTDMEKISGEDILARAGKNLTEWSLNQKLHGGKRIKVDGDWVDLTTLGIERFESVRRQAQQGQ